MTLPAEIGGEPANIEGYVADSLYPSVYHTAFAPAWTDWLLLREGFAAPSSRSGDRASYTVLDIGCGDGLGMIANAYANPQARFVGIDANPAHIRRGCEAAAALGLDNAELRCATFGDALCDAPLEADYIAVQGVLSWISPNVRDELYALIARNLSPGGMVTIGYNCLPGWSNRAAMQKLLHTLSISCTGSPTERFEAALSQAHALSGHGMAALGEEHFEWMEDIRHRVPPGYLPHEYLNGNWQPLWSADTIRTGAEYGLTYLRSAMPQRLRDDFSLKRAHREALSEIAEPATREIVADLYRDAQFRIDIFCKGEPDIIGEDVAHEAMMAQMLVSRVASAKMEYEVRTEAGTLRFDNLAARSITERLDHGPANLDDIAATCPYCTEADLLNAADALFAANQLIAVDPADSQIDTERFNRWVMAGANPQLNALMTPCGPASTKSDEIGTVVGDAQCRRRLGLES